MDHSHDRQKDRQTGNYGKSGYDRGDERFERLRKADYVTRAEKVIKDLADERQLGTLTATKIRNILTLMNVLYEKARQENEAVLSEDMQSNVQYVRMKLVYEASRDDGKGVRALLEKSKLTEHLNDIGKSKEQLIIVCRYTEALIAFHKYESSKKSDSRANGGQQNVREDRDHRNY